MAHTDVCLKCAMKADAKHVEYMIKTGHCWLTSRKWLLADNCWWRNWIDDKMA